MDGQLSMGIGISKETLTIGELGTNRATKTASKRETENVRNSWRDSFDPFKIAEASGSVSLRDAQLGAIHATLAHWTTSSEPATIVMPTATGKTEAMMGILLKERCSKLLVVVPSDTLRTQTFERFLSLGILPRLEGFEDTIKYPIVGKIQHVPKSKQEIDELFDRCNVLVAIPTSFSKMSDDLLNYLVEKVSHLFIDEAHHIAASQWDRLRNICKTREKRILQFTATPYRNDNRAIGGKIIFNYPLKQAFQQGYFKKIHFEEVLEWDSSKSDEVIAKRALGILRRDLSPKEGYDHLLLARCVNIKRAEEIHRLYSDLAPEFKPQLLHTGLSDKRKREAVALLKSRESRVIVCVDMLGEGFDFPNLKIAALHDVHKSLPITLQFIGRFVRTVSSSRIGDAKVIANIALLDVAESLQQLYSQDSNWNEILQYHSDAKIKKQIGLEEFMESFAKGDYEEISLQNLRPKMSAVVYKMEAKTRWNIQNMKKIGGGSKDRVIKTALNEKEKVFVIVEGTKNYIEWGKFKDINNLIWDLYLVYWDEENDLLFINSSNNNSLHEELAKEVGGEKVALIKGEVVFRAFHGVNRVILQNVGLNNPHGRAITYTMYTGIDVEQGLSDAQTGTKFKSNLFGIGFEDGEKTSVGCSYKGRIWSRKNSSIPGFVNWCKLVGKKLLDPKVDRNVVLKNALKRIEITSLPRGLYPISIEWDQGIYDNLVEREVVIYEGKKSRNLDDTSIEILDIKYKTNEIIFRVFSDIFDSEYSLKLVKGGIGGSDFKIELVKGKSLWLNLFGRQTFLVDHFNEFPPVIRLTDGSFLEGNIFAKVRKTPVLYKKAKVAVLDWKKLNVDITRESRGKIRGKISINDAVIEELKNSEYDIIFDDDASGEIADIIAIKEKANQINIELFHCKFSSTDKAGARVKDIYEVCGQAMKCIQWKSLSHKIFDHMIRRARGKTVKGFEKGNEKELMYMKNKVKTYFQMNLSVHIIQPGISKGKISKEILDLLGATELYLRETYRIPLKVTVSN